eukprot:6188228-Pleurochrysis_carterae.AAC.5
MMKSCANAARAAASICSVVVPSGAPYAMFSLMERSKRAGSYKKAKRNNICGSAFKGKVDTGESQRMRAGEREVWRGKERNDLEEEREREK